MKPTIVCIVKPVNLWL